MPRSPLFEKLESSGARFTSFHGWEIPASFGSVENEYGALQQAAGLADLSHRGRILASGRDAARFLHGMVTNDVKGLKTGHGNYAFLLDIHGHILADARILRIEEKTFLLDCEPQLAEVIVQALRHHIIADVVKLEDRGGELACLALEGPAAGQALRNATGFEPLALEPLQHVFDEAQGIRVVRASLCGGEGYWILAAPDAAARLWQKFCDTAAGSGVRPVGLDAMEICRIERGVPRCGIDITEKNLPQETGQMQAVSFTKGCYIGQETVERLRSRGHVNRVLARLLFDGRQEVPPQAEVLADGQAAGSITSSAYSFGLGRTVALGYLRRESAAPGSKVSAGALPAEVAALSASG